MCRISHVAKASAALLACLDVCGAPLQRTSPAVRPGWDDEWRLLRRALAEPHKLLLAMQLVACLEAEAGHWSAQEWQLLLRGSQAQSAGQEALLGVGCLAATAQSTAAWEGLKLLEDLPAFQVCARSAHSAGPLVTLHGVWMPVRRVAAIAGLGGCCGGGRSCMGGVGASSRTRGCSSARVLAGSCVGNAAPAAPKLPAVSAVPELCPAHAALQFHCARQECACHVTK